MQWYKDSINNLNYAARRIKELEKDVHGNRKVDINYLKPQVNELLKTIRAPLDYFAVYVGKSIKDKADNPGFPFGRNVDIFNVKYKEKININSVPLKKLFLSVQSFNKSTWLRELNQMCNDDKHQKINKQQFTLRERVDKFEELGIVLEGFTVERSDPANQTAFALADENGNIIKDFDISESEGYEKTITYTFESTNKEVFSSLHEYYVNVLDFIEEGKRIIGGI